ncbi:hypothetical protein RGQ15_14670 [Paracoccus sp. MBLB3053]|uniref:Uncharacterized protein n=1 Tax=Paracoccus aurantius TaxID=3073814 RepID=A0ABU2HUS8_9RHOB|nr:hypothetical protein [Paracoccus sp. MBLB3053]MDS9468806.1 hypothetical protein [Paracoccus sp. MBLB3053]
MIRIPICSTMALLALVGQLHAHSVKSEVDEAVEAAFDIIETRISIRDDTAVFSTRVRGEAGSQKPSKTGKFEGSDVYAYVWPTSLDSSEVGFEAKQGIVALAVTFHPDFDDAANGGVNRDVWHPHWVVLAEDKACGGGLKVIDIPEGAMPKLPSTWPGVPLLIDSPDYPTSFMGDAVDVEIPLHLIAGIAGASYDGVTAGLKVDGNLHAPLLCVGDVFKVASGNLSLPGMVVPLD